jgi:two-component system cell cycle response regulator DivK
LDRWRKEVSFAAVNAEDGDVRILMIEDNESNAYLARFLLERRGHEVVIATTGGEGVALARASGFEVILLDLRLPDGDGCEFADDLLHSNPGSPPPVIAVSAHALVADRDRAIDVGCCGFIEKPIDVATFTDRVEQLAAARH